MISLIAAVAENGVIGNHNDLPWKIKSEMKYFVRMTKGKPIILGRQTFESVGNPLKDRPNIVVTRDTGYRRDDATVTHSIEEALAAAKKIAAETGQDEIMIGGGAEIYKLALPVTDRMYITEVHLQPEGDTHFPDYDPAEWEETKSEFHKAAEGESADYTIRVLDRKK